MNVRKIKSQKCAYCGALGSCLHAHDKKCSPRLLLYETRQKCKVYNATVVVGTKKIGLNVENSHIDNENAVRRKMMRKRQFKLLTIFFPSTFSTFSPWQVGVVNRHLMCLRLYIYRKEKNEVLSENLYLSPFVLKFLRLSLLSWDLI